MLDRGGGNGAGDKSLKQEKRDAKRRTELAIKLQDTVVDELDKMVAETDTGAGAADLSQAQNSRADDRERERQGAQAAETRSQPQSSASKSQQELDREWEESERRRRRRGGGGGGGDAAASSNNAREGGMGSMSRSGSNRGGGGGGANDPILAEIERLKQDYARSGSRDPNMLSAIHALERDYALRQSGGRPMGGGAGGQPYSQPYSQPMQYGQQMPPNPNPYAPQQFQQPMMGAPMMGMGAMNPMAMQQQMMMQQQMQQQQMAMERQRMEREMEEMMREREDDRFGAQRMQMQQMMAGLTSAIAAGNSGGGGSGGGTALQTQLAMMAGGGGGGGGTSTSSGAQIIDENALRQLAMLSQGPLKDSDLYKLHMQHLSELTKTRLEMDKLEQQQTLLQMQKDLKRRQEEHEKDAEHELYMAEKRRQLRAARIQRILAKEMPGGADGPEQFSTTYDPQSGLLIWFDFALGIPTRFRKLQLVYCFAIDTQVQTKPKALPVADCEPENNNHQKAIFGGTRKVSQVSVAAKTRVVIEIQSVSGASVGGSAQMESIGWTALDFFVPEDGTNENSRLVLNAGLHRLPLQRGAINWQALGNVKLPTTPHISMFVRIVGAADNGRAKIMSIEPSVVQYNYRYPRAIKGVPKGMRGAAAGGKAAARGRRAEMLARKKARMAASKLGCERCLFLVVVVVVVGWSLLYWQR